MDKLRKALSGQEEVEEERGFVAQVENIGSFSSHLTIMICLIPPFRLWTHQVCRGTLALKVSVYVLVSASSALSWDPSSSLSTPWAV